MRAYDVAVIPGDGIGPELTEATIAVLSAVQERVGLELNLARAEAGDECSAKRGEPLPSDTIDAVKGSHACLKGPVGETAADVIVRLRLMLDLYANLRPAKSLPGVPCLRPDVDLLIVRENTEDVYRGYEFSLGEAAVALRLVTRRGSERIARLAFELAMRRKKKVTAVHKSNVLKVTCGLFADTCREVAKAYPAVEYDELYVDAAAMNLIRNPHLLDVIVTTNLFGDILSDEAAQVVGGLGLAPAANIGDHHAIFEPVHGSAPDIAGKGIANPCSMVLSAGMMLDWLHHRYGDERCSLGARLVERAVAEALARGTRTPDLGGGATTRQMGEAIAKLVREG